jgi:hypothetical protein
MEGPRLEHRHPENNGGKADKERKNVKTKFRDILGNTRGERNPA